MKMKKLKRYNEEMEKILFNAFDMLSNAGFDVDVNEEQGYMSIISRDYSIQFDLAEGIVLIPDNEKELSRFNKRQKELMNTEIGLFPMHI
jgi:hypothetical protein